MTKTNPSGAVFASAALLLAGCGGGTSSPGVAHLSTTSGGSAADSGAAAATSGSSTATADGAASTGSTAPEAAALAFAKCMRSNGVPDFPDPKPGGGFIFHRGAGIDPSSPVFKAAQNACAKLMPGGGIGSGPPPSAQTVAHYLKVARCMRRHGVPDFPDPRTSVPSNLHPPAGAARFVISDIEGVILVMGPIDTQSPAFMRAAAVCAFPLHDH
jgi:hypothetical protein